MTSLNRAAPPAASVPSPPMEAPKSGHGIFVYDTLTPPERPGDAAAAPLAGGAGKRTAPTRLSLSSLAPTMLSSERVRLLSRVALSDVLTVWNAYKSDDIIGMPPSRRPRAPVTRLGKHVFNGVDHAVMKDAILAQPTVLRAIRRDAEREANKAAALKRAHAIVCAVRVRVPSHALAGRHDGAAQGAYGAPHRLLPAEDSAPDVLGRACY